MKTKVDLWPTSFLNTATSIFFCNHFFSHGKLLVTLQPPITMGMSKNNLETSEECLQEKHERIFQSNFFKNN